jgi:hypothetical protein
MQDIKALVVKNDLQLEQAKIDSLLSQLSRGSLSFLSPEREAGPFLLYCCGDDFKTISIKCSLPLEIILITAMYYKWPTKAELLQKDITAQSIEDLQKDMTKSLLVATYIAMQKQLGDVIAGRTDASKCGLIPKNMQSLGRLMDMVQSLTESKDHKDSAGGGTRTTITANNVQVINNTNEPAKIEEKKESVVPESERDAMADELGKI